MNAYRIVYKRNGYVSDHIEKYVVARDAIKAIEFLKRHVKKGYYGSQDIQITELVRVVDSAIFFKS